MENLIQYLKIKGKDVLVDNGEQGFWNKSWYETRYGLVNPNGYFVVPPIFANITESENMFIASYSTKGGKRIFFLDNTGKIVVNNKYNIIDTKGFKNGYCLIQTADLLNGGYDVPWPYVSNLCKWGLIDKKGNILVSPKYSYEHDVKVKDVNILVNEIKHNGVSILNYADENLYSSSLNVVKFKRALKLYLLNYYAKNRNKEALKIELEKQNKEFKKIKFRKLAENLFTIKNDKVKKYNIEEREREL